MRFYLVMAAGLVGSVCALVTAPSAEDIPQPGAAPSTMSTNFRYGKDTWQSILLSQDIQGALGKGVRSSTGENLGAIDRPAEVFHSHAGRIGNRIFQGIDRRRRLNGRRLKRGEVVRAGQLRGTGFSAVWSRCPGHPWLAR